MSGDGATDVARVRPGRWVALLLLLAVVGVLGAGGDGTAGATVGVGAAGPTGAGVGRGAGAAGGAAGPTGVAVEAATAWSGAGAGSAAPRAVYAWPLAPTPVVVRPFQEPMHRFGPGHRGVDLVAARGAPVRAAADGVVVFAAALAGRGVVSVQHADGLRTTYEPVTPVVAPGVHVPRGAVLGTLDAGHAGCPTACLHWGVRRDRTTYVDPLVLLAPPRVRLLPLPEPWPDGPAPEPAPVGPVGGGSRRGWGAVRPAGAPARGPPSAAPR